MIPARPPLRLLSVCSGVGGLDIAAEATGSIVVVGQVEIDPYNRRVLKQHFPHVIQKADIHDVRGDEFGPIDILAGGIPCQGNSFAGKRKGRSDDRNLWPEFRRLLRATGARWAVVENVRGLLSANVDRRSRDHGLFGDILRDLAHLRYTVGWYVLSAAAVGAPHKRERVFLIAHRDALADADEQRGRAWGSPCAGSAGDATPLRNGQLANARREGCQCGGDGSGIAEIRTIYHDGSPDGSTKSLADPASLGWRGRQDSKGYQPDGDAPRWAQSAGEPESAGDTDLADAQGVGQREPHDETHAVTREGNAWQGALRRGQQSRQLAHPDRKGLSVGDRSATPRGTRPAANQHAGDLGQTQSRLGGMLAGVAYWLDGLSWPGWPSRPGESQHVYEPPRTITGTLKDRAARLKALGNLLMPHQAYPAFDAIVAVEFSEEVA